MQIDFKEEILLSNGTYCSWLNMADEGSTAHLKAVIFPQKRASQVNLLQATKAVNQGFSQWGLPLYLKIDNGYPFVNPNYRQSLCK